MFYKPFILCLACLVILSTSNAYSRKKNKDFINVKKKLTTTRVNLKSEFETVDINQYTRKYPGTYNRWFSGTANNTENAKRWNYYLGPLGIKVLPHIFDYQNKSGFRKIVPLSIQTTDGKLALNAAEVTFISKGSPAEKHLMLGDLILGVSQQTLKLNFNYNQAHPSVHLKRRGLKPFLGYAIDQAQNKGYIDLVILRPNQQVVHKFTGQIKSQNDLSTPALKVSPGQIIILETKKTNNAVPHAEIWWESALFNKKNQQKIKFTKQESAWGKVQYLENKTNDTTFLQCYANSTISFIVPEGVTHFQPRIYNKSKSSKVKIRIRVLGSGKAMPIKKQLLWQGKAGNRSKKAQKFNINLPAKGYLFLESNSYDRSIKGDGTAWLDVNLHQYGKTTPLLQLAPFSISSGYGRPKLQPNKQFHFKNKTYQGILNLHAQGTATWHLNKPYQRVSGSFAATNYGTVQPKIYFQANALPLQGWHLKQTRIVRVPVAKTKSFSQNYPKNCQKSATMATRHVSWLANQQRKQGNWLRAGSNWLWTTWDTSWAALALMASGDKKYDKQIKKAAYFIGYDSYSSEWCIERAMALIFLSEYYLRYGDKKILAGLQNTYNKLIACCKSDFVSGHKINGFGYGITGQHYATGHLVLAIALASKTPITMDKKLNRNIIKHAGEVCVNGYYAYGRGNRKRRNDKRHHYGGNARSGPAALGMIIAGGHAKSIQEFTERWREVLGDGDNTHTIPSIAFIFTSLAMSIEDPKLFRDHMQYFRYKMTLDDNWEGGFLNSSFALDLQSGEGYVNYIIRTAGYSIVLNAPKRNLAITGNPEFKKKKRISTVAVSEWGNQIYSYYLRNLSIAKQWLAGKSPNELIQTIKQLKQLPKTINLIPQTKKLLLENLPTIIQKVVSDNSLSKLQKAHVIELVTGLDFKISISQKRDSLTQNFDLQITLPLHQLNWLDTNKAVIFKNSALSLRQASINISSDLLVRSSSVDWQPNKKFNNDTGTYKTSKKLLMKRINNQSFQGNANIKFQLGNYKFSYNRPLIFNSKDKYRVKLANFRRIKLVTRMAPRAYYQSQALMFAGKAFDCMFPVERTPPYYLQKGNKTVIKSKESHFIHEGDQVTAEVISDNMLCAWVVKLTFSPNSQVTLLAPKKVTAIRGKISGDITNLIDDKSTTECLLQPPANNKKAVLEFEFERPVTANGIDLSASSEVVFIWYQHNNNWVPLVWDSYTTHTSFGPTFPAVKAKKWRIRFNSNHKMKIDTLRFYFNTNLQNSYRPLLQMLKRDVYPSNLKP